MNHLWKKLHGLISEIKVSINQKIFFQTLTRTKVGTFQRLYEMEDLSLIGSCPTVRSWLKTKLGLNVIG